MRWRKRKTIPRFILGYTYGTFGSMHTVEAPSIEAAREIGRTQRQRGWMLTDVLPYVEHDLLTLAEQSPVENPVPVRERVKTATVMRFGSRKMLPEEEIEATASRIQSWVESYGKTASLRQTLDGSYYLEVVSGNLAQPLMVADFLVREEDTGHFYVYTEDSFTRRYNAGDLKGNR